MKSKSKIDDLLFATILPAQFVVGLGSCEMEGNEVQKCRTQHEEEEAEKEEGMTSRSWPGR